MVSSSLTFLRSAPQAQADVYNAYAPKATKIRQDVYVSGEAKLAQLAKLVSTAQSTLESLLQETNDAELAIRKAAQTQDADASEAALLTVRRLLDSGMDIPTICQGLVEDADRDGFNAMRKEIRWQIRAGKLNESFEKVQAGLLEYEKQIMPPAEYAKHEELRELIGCIQWLRQNFTDLGKFFDGQLLPSAVQGAFTRLERLTGWFGLRDVYSGPSFVSLTDDFGGQYAPSQYGVNAR